MAEIAVTIMAASTPILRALFHRPQAMPAASEVQGERTWEDDQHSARRLTIGSSFTTIQWGDLDEKPSKNEEDV